MRKPIKEEPGSMARRVDFVWTKLKSAAPALILAGDPAKCPRYTEADEILCTALGVTGDQCLQLRCTKGR